ncbi:histidine phosphatase family protein [Vibrio parahaemolyticus]|uniref:histidine phosphatase family protein n=1 Tax=Vibrio parahaemolyticus TaxID=670 RepID=UPI00044B5A64|nr:histidine phosphatase family protein [Vibrio parahaemolyticus]EJG0872225.1 histidine phosphatase family protein [Vibrio parahaemolyticus O3]EJG0900884.1 histidine phosphatase family protein [Vibrio parahaemolyticus O3:K56]EJG1072978.1 histidine phosphatase family protein [Vibrio parahaemolyticus O1:K56]EGQ8276721.1 histidine phosphatase family protein [Vibrio parahaemolyticus]EGQ8937678.1 histidine phosphatase family protein [Vibrio parahaemolyticus]
MTRRIFVLRHGETEFNADKKLQGHCNSSLTSKGSDQARRVGTTLKQYVENRLFRVYSSTLGRALQTSQIVCEELNYSYENLNKEPRLKEFSLGEWEQRTIPSLEQEIPNLLAQNDWYLQAPNCETYESVRERLSSWLSDVAHDEDIVVVSHGLTGIVLRGLLLGMDYTQVWQQDLPQDAFFIIEDGRITRVNCVDTVEVV